MTTPCDQCPLRKRDAFVPFSDSELDFMKKFKVGELKIDAGTPILMEGSNAPQLYTALRGMGIRYKTLMSGERQVINLVFPGDFLGLQARVMGQMCHSVEATTAMTLCVFDRSGLWALFKDSPERAFDVTWLSAIEEHFLGESLLTLGQRSAIEGVAWALVKIAQRGRAIGIFDNGRMPFPFRQQDLADSLGLSLVHTNKTLRKLRDRQLATWTDKELHISDLDALAAIAQLDVADQSTRPLL